MVITQDYIDSELALAKKIFIYYTDKILEYTTIGSTKYHDWYTDSLEIYILMKYLENVTVSSGVPYIGAGDIDIDDLLSVFHKLREYYKSDIDVDYEIADINIPLITGYTVPFQAKWREFVLEVTEDAPSQITMPVSIEIMDSDSIQLSVNGLDDPNYDTDLSTNGYHMVGNILYWHGFYDLRTGDTIRVQYLQIVG